MLENEEKNLLQQCKAIFSEFREFKDKMLDQPNGALASILTKVDKGLARAHAHVEEVDRSKLNIRMFQWIVGFIIMGIITVSGFTYSATTALKDDQHKLVTKEDHRKLEEKVEKVEEKIDKKTDEILKAIRELKKDNKK